jgi:hypothetical protein
MVIAAAGPDAGDIEVAPVLPIDSLHMTPRCMPDTVFGAAIGTGRITRGGSG